MQCWIVSKFYFQCLVECSAVEVEKSNISFLFLGIYLIWKRSIPEANIQEYHQGSNSYSYGYHGYGAPIYQQPYPYAGFGGYGLSQNGFSGFRRCRHGDYYTYH